MSTDERHQILSLINDFNRGRLNELIDLVELGTHVQTGPQRTLPILREQVADRIVNAKKVQDALKFLRGPERRAREASPNDDAQSPSASVVTVAAPASSPPQPQLAPAADAPAAPTPDALSTAIAALATAAAALAAAPGTAAAAAALGTAAAALSTAAATLATTSAAAAPAPNFVIELMPERCVETGSCVRAHWIGERSPSDMEKATLQYIVDLIRFGFRTEVAVQMARAEKRDVMVDFPDSAEFAVYTVMNELESVGSTAVPSSLSNLLRDTAISQVQLQQEERPDLDLLSVYELMVQAEVMETRLLLTCGVPSRCVGTLMGDAAIQFMSGGNKDVSEQLSENGVRVVVHSTDGPERGPAQQVALDEWVRSLPPNELLFAHGTTRAAAVSIIRQGIKLTKCREKADFGRAFYLTPIENLCDAVSFANTVVNRSFTQIRPEPPECAVLVYARVPDPDETHLEFAEDDHKWRRAVLSFRNPELIKKPTRADCKYVDGLQRYDSIEGPVAATDNRDPWASEAGLRWLLSKSGSGRMWQLALRSGLALRTLRLVGLFVFPRSSTEETA